jgi:Sporulation and spore germination
MAAAAIVGVALAAGACGIPTANSPTAIAKAAVPYHLLDPPTTTTTAPGTPPAVGVAEQIYLVSPDGHLVAADREVAVPASSSQVLGALLAGPTATETASGIQSFLTGNGVRASVTEAGGIATVHFSTSPIQVVGPDQTVAIAQVVYTVTQDPGITGVLFEIGGKPIEVPTATAAAQVPGPVGRADYLPQGPVA